MKKNILFAIIIAASSLTACGQNKGKGNSGSENIEAKKGKFPITKTDAEWRATLTPATYEIMVKEGTEPPFKNEFYNNHKKGIYVSAATGEPLFSSDDKFDSGTGWPSFSKPINEKAVIWAKDTSYGMSRDEVVDAKTGLHLGHVFNDGPAPTGTRYCINSAALKFIPAK